MTAATYSDTLYSHTHRKTKLSTYIHIRYTNTHISKLAASSCTKLVSVRTFHDSCGVQHNRRDTYIEVKSSSICGNVELCVLMDVLERPKFDYGL